MAKTEAMNRIKTEKMGGIGETGESQSPVLIAPAVFEYENETYDITPNLIAVGGEAQVYQATQKSNGTVCVAKIDTSGLLYKKENVINRKVIIDFLKTHSDYRHSHIIPLLASGTIYIAVSDDAPALPYPVDIFPFCPDGDLESAKRKYSYSELRSRVIPAINAALTAIHGSNIIHRDIKPANIYEYNGEIVVSDFGTAVFTVTDEDKPIRTELARHTLGYSAQEINSRYAKKASDYFSLGCTIATLYNGEHPYANVLERESDFVFYNLIAEKGMEMAYLKGDEPLKWLIDTLVRINPSERADGEAVSSWLSDTKAFYDKYVAPGIQPQSAERWEKPFVFEDKQYWNESDLAAAFIADWSAAKRYLYRGQVYKFFEFNQTLQNRADRIVNEMPTAKNDDLGLAQFIHYLLRGGNLYWCGNEYKALTEIGNFINSNENVDDNIVKMIKSGYISWKMGQDDKDKEKISKVEEIETISSAFPTFAYHYAGFQWATENPLKDETVDDYLHFDGKEFYNTVINDIKDPFYWAVIASFGYLKQIIEIMKKFGENFRENVEVFYQLFETICSEKKVVRTHYCRFSPDSYLHWLKNNMGLYSFHSADAQKLCTKIESVPVSEDMSLGELRNSFRELAGYFSDEGDFKHLFQGDFVIACLGLLKGNDRHGEITATKADAFFIDRFLGRDVPVGFRKSLGLPQDCCLTNEMKLK